MDVVQKFCTAILGIITIKNFTKNLNHRRVKKILLGFIISTFAICSCNDDYFNLDVDDKHMDKIGYNVNIADNDEFQSRGSSTNTHITVNKLDATIGGKDLYLHTVVKDTISKEALARKFSKSMSRGTIIDSESIDEIAVSAIVINDSEAPKGWPVTGDAQMYMNNEPVYKDYNWTTGRYWPQEQDSIRFYAYSPVGALDDESQDDTKGLPNMSNDEPDFYYRVSDNIEEQQDLLVAAAQYKGNYCKPAQINMCHALTAVEIHISEDVKDFTLYELTLSGIENEGFYGYKFIRNEEDVISKDAGSWTLNDTDGQLASYQIYNNAEGLELTGTEVNLTCCCC